jgi:hypothetical protein
MGPMRNGYKILVRKPKGKRPLGRPRSRWEDSIRTDLREIGYVVVWMYLAQKKDHWLFVMDTVMKLEFH